MDKVFYLDTVFGSGGPLDRVNGDLCNKTPGSIKDPTVVIAKGAWEAGDGGGGTFLWDKNGGIDDGGTVIVPANQSNSNSGCWRRVSSTQIFPGSAPAAMGILNVKWFGAKGDSSLDDTKFIQAAINAAVNARGGTVYFPQGVYLIGDPGIRIPRVGPFGSFPLLLKGEGTGMPYSDGKEGCSTLRSIDLSEGTSMLWYDDQENGIVEFHSIEGLTFARENSSGPMVYHGSNDGWSQRIRIFISKCIFMQSAVQDSTGNAAPSNSALIDITGGWNGAIQDVGFAGGKYCLYLKDTARYTLDRVMTLQKYNSRNFIVLDGGGTYFLRNCRSEGGAPATINGVIEDIYALHVTGSYNNITKSWSNVGQVTIDNFTTEALEESIQVYIERACSVRIRNISLGSHQSNGRPVNHAIKIGKLCSNVHIDGGILPAYSGTYDINTHTGDCSIYVEGGARDILMDNLSFGDGVQNGNGNVVIDESSIPVINVRIHAIEKFNDAGDPPYNYRYHFEQGIISPAWIDTDNGKNCLQTLPKNANQYHQESGARIYSLPVGQAELKGISSAFEGAIVTLIIPDSTTSDLTIYHKYQVDTAYLPIYISAASDLIVKPGSAVRFIKSGNYWYYMQ